MVPPPSAVTDARTHTPNQSIWRCPAESAADIPVAATAMMEMTSSSMAYLAASWMVMIRQSTASHASVLQMPETQTCPSPNIAPW